MRTGVHQGALLLPGLKRLAMAPHVFATSADARLLVSGGPCDLLLVWSLEDGVLQHAVQLPPDSAAPGFATGGVAGVVQLAFLPDCQTVAVLTRGGAVRFVDVLQCQLTGELAPQKAVDRLSSMSLDARANALAGIRLDGQARARGDFGFCLL